jgi:hypothetical protein
MPSRIGLLGYGNAQFTGVRRGRVEQAKFDLDGILGVEGKVDAFLSECGAQRIGLSAPNFQVSFHDGAVFSYFCD